MEEQKNGQTDSQLEELFVEIEDILEKMDDKEISLEKSFLLYEDGMKKLKQCNDKIDQVEKKMQVILEQGDLAEFLRENYMEFQTELTGRIAEIEAVLKQYLPKEEGYQKTVLEAMNYSILAGGKRLRPMLMIETYRLFGGKGKVIEPFAAAIEMIHTYSLVHDDLPAMDNDEYRRGKKTTHAVYGEAMGILAGDALLNFAYETAAKAFSMEDGSAKAGRAFQVLAKKAGIYGMVGGQVADVESEGETEISLEKLSFIYRLKTGALMEAAMVVGAILAGASTEEQHLIEQIAADIGMAFQIQDDILDVTSTLEVLGKPIGSDEKNRKITYVALMGMEQAKEKASQLFYEAMARLDSLSVKNPFLTELLRALVHREK